MQIFYVDSDPKQAAQSLVDQHVNKQVAETAQELSNCYTLEQLADPKCPRTKKGTPRKHSYPHHPCCKWPQKSLLNFYWLVAHGHWLEQERLYRGMNPHHSYKFIVWCGFNPPLDVDIGEFTPPPQAFSGWEELKGDDTVEAYRRYYNVAKWLQQSLKKVWTKRNPPDWWEH